MVKTWADLLNFKHKMLKVGFDLLNADDAGVEM